MLELVGHHGGDIRGLTLTFQKSDIDMNSTLQVAATLSAASQNAPCSEAAAAAAAVAAAEPEPDTKKDTTVSAKSGESTVLEETIDENYEPTVEEIAEYAKWLGMDLEADKHLFWMAREGLKAPLPKEWKPCQSPEGELYYFNFTTGESVWDHPRDDHYRNMYQEEKKKNSKPAPEKSED
eukprot:COSAG02_NODE_10363_length_1958_cov_370.780263_2_plen_179_part_01